MKFDFGYIWKMFIGLSYTKCKSEIPIVILVFPILLNEKNGPIFVFLVISTNKTIMGLRKVRFFWYNFTAKIIPDRR